MSIARRIKMFTDKDIFITNTTSTYEDIPKDCKLVGAEFNRDYSTHYRIGAPTLTREKNPNLLPYRGGSSIKVIDSVN
jgi:hypothetical protein